MLGFVLISSLAFLPISWCSPMQESDLSAALKDARFGDLTELCDWFCSDWDSDYFDYFSRSSGKDKIQPRIFCGLCPAAPTTTTAGSVTATPPSNSSPTGQDSSSTQSSTTTGPTSTAAP